jgi:hypothetical protein
MKEDVKLHVLTTMPILTTMPDANSNELADYNVAVWLFGAGLDQNLRRIITAD